MSLEVDFLNVGDGDAIILRRIDPLFGEHVTLIDGGNPSDGEAVVRHILRHTDRKQVDLVVSTHGDQDHLGGLFTVIEQIPVGHVLIHDPRAVLDVPGTVERLRRRTTEGLEDRAAALERAVRFIRELDRRGISWEEPFSDGVIRGLPPYLRVCGPTRAHYRQALARIEPPSSRAIAEALFKNLGSQTRRPRGLLGLPLPAPPAPAPGGLRSSLLTAGAAPSLSRTMDEKEDESPMNEASVVLMAHDGDRRLLFTSDANEIALLDAARGGPVLFSDLFLLQVPHHGSKRNLSSPLLRLFSPKVAVISAAGTRKHPSQAVIHSLGKVGAQVYSTHQTAEHGSLWLPSPGAYRYGYGWVPPLQAALPRAV